VLSGRFDDFRAGKSLLKLQAHNFEAKANELLKTNPLAEAKRQ
jgi:hypothetical protein